MDRKYKIGDKVVASDASGYHDHEIGEIIAVIEDSSSGGIIYKYAVRYLRGGEYWSKIHRHAQECFKKVVVTSDGRTTTAKLYDGKKEVKSAVAVCSDDDVFDFDFGAKLALERLFDEPTNKLEDPEEKLYNGKVVCVEAENDLDSFIAGKIYEIKDGKFTDENGNIRPLVDVVVRDVSDLTKPYSYFANWPFRFIPFVE